MVRSDWDSDGIEEAYENEYALYMILLLSLNFGIFDNIYLSSLSRNLIDVMYISIFKNTCDTNLTDIVVGENDMRWRLGDCSNGRENKTNLFLT